MSEYKEDFVKLSDTKIWYCIYGENSLKTPVIVLHGGPGATHDYLLPLKELAKERQIIFYDQHGSGNSKVPFCSEDYSVLNFVEELNALIKHLKLKDIILLGQSWGSALALEYFDKYLNVNIEKIIFSAPFFSTDIWSHDTKNLIRDLPMDLQEIILFCEEKGDFENENYLKAMDYFYAQHLCRIKPYPQELLKTFEKMSYEVYSYMWGPSEFTITGILKDYCILEKLHHVNIPTLFTCGEFDEAAPESVKYYASIVDKSKIAVFKDASHEHHLEKKEKYLQIVNDFLNM